MGFMSRLLSGAATPDPLANALLDLSQDFLKEAGVRRSEDNRLRIAASFYVIGTQSMCYDGGLSAAAFEKILERKYAGVTSELREYFKGTRFCDEAVRQMPYLEAICNKHGLPGCAGPGQYASLATNFAYDMLGVSWKRNPNWIMSMTSMSAFILAFGAV